MIAVDYSVSGARAADGAVVNMWGQRAQDEHSVDAPVVVYRTHQPDDLLLSDLRLEVVFTHADAGGFAAFSGAALVGDIIAVFPHSDYRERRRGAQGAQFVASVFSGEGSRNLQRAFL